MVLYKSEKIIGIVVESLCEWCLHGTRLIDDAQEVFAADTFGGFLKINHFNTALLCPYAGENCSLIILQLGKRLTDYFHIFP